MITWAQAQLKLGITFKLNTNEQGILSSKVTSFVMENTSKIVKSGYCWFSQLPPDNLQVQRGIFKAENQLVPLIFLFFIMLFDGFHAIPIWKKNS